MADTVRVDPHASHWRKNSRFSLVSRVSADLQVLQVTYSTGGRVSSVRDDHTNVPLQDIFNLLLLEPALDDQSLVSINGPSCSQFSKQELNHVIRLTMFIKELS